MLRTTTCWGTGNPALLSSALAATLLRASRAEMMEVSPVLHKRWR
ncbi:MAG: hypothetical protein Q8M01_10610 [Rubrivivax sp.]|nr:hypothetical protein [Rubrivivax sp.]